MSNKPDKNRQPLSQDYRGVLGYILAIILGASLISSVLILGLNTTGNAQQSNPASTIDSVQTGVSSGLDETNDIVINQGSTVTLESSAVNWDSFDSKVGRQNIGTLLTAIESQQKSSGKVTQVKPVDEGVNSGAFLKQWDTDSYSTETKYTEYHDVDHTHYSDHTHTDYDYRETHYTDHNHPTYDYIDSHENLNQNCHGVAPYSCYSSDRIKPHGHREWVDGYYKETTYTYEETHTNKYTYTETHTDYFTHQHWSTCPSVGLRINICQVDETHAYTFTETHTNTYTYTDQHTGTTETWVNGYFETVEYNHGFEVTYSDHRHDTYCSGCDKVQDGTYTETHSNTHTHDSYCSGCDRFIAGTTNHVHSNNHVHKDQKEHTHTQTTQVSGGSYKYNGDSDWNVMKDTSEYRDSKFIIQNNGLSKSEVDAFEMYTNDGWSMTVWQNEDGNTQVKTSTGYSGTYNGAITVDPETDTISGDVVEESGTFTFADSSGHTLRVKNGDNAFGNYKIVSDGNLADPSDGVTTVEDTTTTQAAFLAADDIVYSADLEVTYESSDTTVTTRLFVEPIAEATDKPA